MFDKKYHILHDFRTFISFKGKSSDRLKIELHKLKLLTNFDINLKSSLGVKCLIHNL